MNKSTVLSAVLLSALLFSSATLATAQEAKKTIKKVAITNTSPGSGEEMFNTYCAVCHGKSGKGDGPAASEFKIPPANLTLLAQNHNGKYPDSYIAQVIETGPQGAKAHGSQDMPVWGSLFKKIDQSASVSTVKLRIYNLNKFIESIQVK